MPVSEQETSANLLNTRDETAGVLSEYQSSVRGLADSQEQRCKMQR